MTLNFHPKKITDIPDNLKGYLYAGFILPTICIVVCVIGILISNQILSVTILALPFFIASAIIIDHFINYYKNRTVKRSINNFHTKTIEIQTKEQRIVKLNRDTVKLVYEYSVPSRWRRLPWGEFSYIKVLMTDDSYVIINDIESDIGLLTLLLTSYGVTVINVGQFTNMIEHTTVNKSYNQWRVTSK
jgi:hypothetical protein